MVHGSRFRVLVVATAVTTGLYGQTTGGPVRVEMSDEAMGTTFTVVVHGPDRTALEVMAREALDEAARIDNLLSNYKPESEWTAMNRAAGRAPFTASQELFDVIAASLHYSRVTDGAFDISVGPLMKTWGFFRGEGAMPDAVAVTRALEDVGWQRVRIDRATRTIALLASGVELDPGGIGKGYAVDRMAAVLKARGATAALISAGGSSIYGLGAPPDSARGWPVRIRHPQAPAQTAAAVFLEDASLSTSGGDEKFFRAGGRVYSHIMDPRTGFPARGTSSVSVIAPRAMDGEAWTKAYFVNGRAWATRHRPVGTRAFMCDDSVPVDCGWIE